LDYRQLFKLCLVVAAMDETQRLGWWNRGVLTGTGEFLFQQGFPRSAPLEDAFENERIRGMDQPQEWAKCAGKGRRR
jgi:hypothetical protein